MSGIIVRNVQHRTSGRTDAEEIVAKQKPSESFYHSLLRDDADSIDDSSSTAGHYEGVIDDSENTHMSWDEVYTVYNLSLACMVCTCRPLRYTVNE